ncbi:c-type cytochrome [Chitinophaga sedimenti]|uniref:c-type cytochrome n=1 Tax=Chitinophaga sedimenti TaxID=2033606 RepID=UPI002005F750|nr:c-type cytochrome [Chitinophaga sedimenti]MCK7555914.1 c-type cytochrome [Chitinophaga sedimenti]
MKKVFKVIGIIVLVLILGVAGVGVYVKTALPNVGPAPEITLKNTPERIANGRYLAHHVAVCMDCHSTRDWSRYAGPMVEKGIGGGGEVFNKQMGFPGDFYAPNITPHALSGWTDGEIFRAVTTGVSKDGHALFPVMGYHRFGQMDQEDIMDVIAYLRTLEPVVNEIPRSKADFPVNVLINTMPAKAAFTKRPAESDQVAYGKYLINASGCVDCHSQTDKGKVIPGTEFGGGMEFAQPAGIVRSPNITFDKANGIGSWSKDMFVQRFKMYTDSGYAPRQLKPGELNTPMPWSMYAGMKTSDLEAIYAYLQSVKPLDNKVERFALNTPSK